MASNSHDHPGHAGLLAHTGHDKCTLRLHQRSTLIWVNATHENLRMRAARDLPDCITLLPYQWREVQIQIFPVAVIQASTKHSAFV